MGRRVFDAVIFDVDGTLIDTVDLHAASWREVLRRWGCELSHDEVRRQIGKGGDQLMPAFLSEDIVRRDGDQIEEERDALFLRDYWPRARAFPKVRSLFERLREDSLQIVLATSGKAEEVERYARLAGIDDLIDAVTTSDDVARSKPYPDIFHAAMARLAPITANRTVVVGDTPYDAEAAGKAGVRTIGLLSGGYAREDLIAAGCIAAYWDCAELLAQFSESPIASR